MPRVLLYTVCLLVAPAAALGQHVQYETTEIAEGVYQFRWQSHNGLFVATGDGVIVMDPISRQAAERFAAEIRRVAPGQPLVAVVYSHHHPDHASGANILRAVLGPDAPIIAHHRAVGGVAAVQSTDLPPPDLTFSDGLRLHFGERPIELHYLGPSHSDDMIVALLPEDSIVFAVDFVSNDRVGYRDLSSFRFPELYDAIRGLLDLPFNTIVFGHGPPGDRAAVERQLRYYEDLREVVEEAVAAGMSEDQAAVRVRLPAYTSWGGYEDWFPLNVRGMYRWLVNR